MSVLSVPPAVRLNVALDRRFLIALAKDDSPLNALAQAGALRKILSAIGKQHQPKVLAAWEAANTEALNHLAIVIKNNPAKTMEQILARPDVISALTAPYADAAKTSAGILQQAHDQAVKAVQKAVGTTAEPDAALLKTLTKDLHSNAKAMRSRISKILLSYEKHPKDVKAALKGVSNDVVNRAGMSLTAAVWMPVSQIMHQVSHQQILPKPKKGQKKSAKKQQPMLMWVAIIDDRTCSHCKALHGTTVKPHTPFTTTLKIYAEQMLDGGLVGPPAHPNCRCVLIPV